MIEQLCQHVSKSTRRRLRGGKKQHAHEIGDVDVSKGNSVFVEVEQKSNRSFLPIGTALRFCTMGKTFLKRCCPGSIAPFSVNPALHRNDRREGKECA